MSVNIAPVDFETNIPGMVLSNVSAFAADQSPAAVRKNELIVDINHPIRVTLQWDQTGTSPWTDFFLGLAGATWHIKAMLQSVEGGPSASQTAVEVYAGGPGMKDIVVTFPANSVPEGTYQLFVNCHLKSGGGVHLATSFVARGRTYELFNSVMI